MPKIFSKIRELLHSPQFTTQFHKYATMVWITLLIPSLLLWRESILWVILMSVWANIAAHWAAYQASKSEQKQDESH